MKYFGYYDTKLDRRLMSPAAVDKMNYIVQAINKKGIHVEIIACGMVANKKMKSQKIEKEGVTTFYFKTTKKGNNILIRSINRVYENIVLFLYILKNVKKDEQILVYHSLLYMRCFYFAKKIIKFKMILEVEEFYNDIKGLKFNSTKMEKKFIKCADKYIFPTCLMNEKYNQFNKPAVIIHGVYRYNNLPYRNRFSDNKVHVVYAGTFNEQKGGVTAAINTAEYLDENYHLHILGFGTEEEVKHVKEKIIQIINDKKKKCKITYEGALIGDNFIQFLQKCDIGLSCQNPGEIFNETSFPSKILTYLSNGLKVVSIRIKVVETSKINLYVEYYDKQEPHAIANAVQRACNKNDYNLAEIMQKLDCECSNELEKLLLNN